MQSAFNIVMRVISTLIGVLMVLMGGIWIMQGLNVGPRAILRGFMVSDMHWALYGAILALVGIGQAVWSNTGRRASV